MQHSFRASTAGPLPLMGRLLCLRQVYFHGGLQANDASVPINGSVLEMVDLRDMSAYVMQVSKSSTGVVTARV